MKTFFLYIVEMLKEMWLLFLKLNWGCFAFLFMLPADGREEEEVIKGRKAYLICNEQTMTEGKCDE